MDHSKGEGGSSKLFAFLRSHSKDKDTVTSTSSSTGPGGIEETLGLINRTDLTCQEKLGEGSFGAVYKGTWSRPDGTSRVVAIKQMNCGVTSDISYDDVLKEAETQFTLNHPNVVNLFGLSFAKDQQQLWLVMKLVKGQDLSTFIYPERGVSKILQELPFKLKLKICLQVSDAVAYIHERGYLHADIKPQNLMVDQRSGHVYLCDFGITRYLGNMEVQDYATRFTNSFGGTLLYIAPECLKQDKKGRYLRPTFKSDIWSVGASFFEIFAQRHLFDDPMACLKCKTMGDNEYIQKLAVVYTPKEVRKIVMRALEFQPTKRPNAPELTEFLRKLYAATVMPPSPSSGSSSSSRAKK